MIVLNEDFEIPGNIKKVVKYSELASLIDNKALTSSSPLLRYDSAKKAMRIVSTGRKIKFLFTDAGIDMELGPSMSSFISTSTMKQIDYQELHSINGGKPLSTVSVNIQMTDGGVFYFSYQIIGYWRAGL
jgi:hypothetical protein